MNFLKRAITTQVSHSSRSSRQCNFLPRPLTQSSMYSTTYRLSNPQPRKSRTTQMPQESSPSPAPSSSSSLTWAQRVKKQAEGLTDWPKPSEIPYQAKVANLVNLIGQITTPVKFQSAPHGKYLAGAVISQENEPAFVIPVVFEGDLAHVVASHVKINDCVYVAGRLSEGPLPFVLGEYQANFHVVGENINFVEGFEKKAFRKTKEFVGETSEHEDGDFAHHSSKKLESEICEPKISQTSSGETVKDDDSGNNPWMDLVKNPSQWRDFREQKVNGLVVAKYPDFKRKDGTALWLNSAPEWVLLQLDKLSVGAQGPKQKNVKDAKKEDSWKSLVENPTKWWDNRLGKKHAKAPDFKHKETGEVLWLNNSPSWVLSKLPELKEK